MYGSIFWFPYYLFLCATVIKLLATAPSTLYADLHTDYLNRVGIERTNIMNGVYPSENIANAKPRMFTLF